MFEVLGFGFFQNALLAGVLASIACGIVGTFVVVKHMVSMSGGISHAAFGGIGIGYYLGIDPIIGAVGYTLCTAIGMGVLRRKARQNLDTLVGAVWATGMALGILFLYLSPGFAPDLFGYLFGNILLVPSSTLLLMLVLVAVICAVVALLYNDLIALSFDEDYAAIMDLPVDHLMLALLSMIALTVVMLIQVVGIILVIALLTLPAAISREYTSGIRQMMVSAVLLGAAFTTGGIWLSYLFDIPSGATIILLSAGAYGVAVGVKAYADPSP